MKKEDDDEIKEEVGWLDRFCRLSNLEGYLMPDPVYIYIYISQTYMICKQIICLYSNVSSITIYHNSI